MATKLLLLLLCSCGGWRLAEERERSVLEMLHIQRVAARPQQAWPHPYMRMIYQRLPAQGAADGTLAQSFGSVAGEWHRLLHLA